MHGAVVGWERAWGVALRIIVALSLFFLIFPLFIIAPLSFNALPYFTFTPEMLSLDPAGYFAAVVSGLFHRPELAGRGEKQLHHRDLLHGHRHDFGGPWRRWACRARMFRFGRR